MAKNPHFFVSFRPLLLFLPCILCIFFFFFFVLLLPLILCKKLCFFLCGKKFFTPLFCCVIHELRPKEIVSKIFYHIRQNRVPYLEIKLEMTKNPHFLSVFVLCFFFFRVFCVPFSSATTTYTTTFTTTKRSNCKFFWGFHFISR